MFNLLILLSSLMLYLYFGKESLIVVLFSSLITYYGSKRIYKNKLLLFILILINISILIFFRINMNFNFYNVMVPIGISYYSLQIISYLVDVYKGKYNYESKFSFFLLYIIYFPHIFLGPIYSFDSFKKELSKTKKLEKENIYQGILRICYGLLKKLIVANRIAILISVISSNPTKYSGFYVLFASFLYSIELYSDFSGGIDIVLGISKIFDINLIENFHSPFNSESIKEFWNNWHISLGKWLKEYIYIPLGGNRCSRLRNRINIIITFIVSGIWHGFNYILWGILHGIFVICSFIKTKNKYINRFITFTIVSLLWSFFIYQNSIISLKMIGSIFYDINFFNFINNILNIGLSIIDYLIIIIFTVIIFIYDENKHFINQKLKSLSIEFKLTLICSLIILILILGIYGIGFNQSDFIYNKF